MKTLKCSLVLALALLLRTLSIANDRVMLIAIPQKSKTVMKRVWRALEKDDGSFSVDLGMISVAVREENLKRLRKKLQMALKGIEEPYKLY